MRDEAMLRKVGDTIAAEPERYDQGAYVYVKQAAYWTVCCIAGHAVELRNDFRGWDSGEEDAWIKDRGMVSVGNAAGEALGLRTNEARVLFDSYWEPAGDPSVPLHERVQAALYGLADGKSIEEVTAS